MLDQPIRYLMEDSKLLTAPPEMTVTAAAKLMAAKNAGAVIILKDERLMGIFTERDAVFRVIARGLDAAHTLLSDVMTRAPKTLPPDTSYGHALLLMQENGFRHVPIVENERVIGIVSSRNAMDPDLEEFVSEERRREHFR
ncbi:MAG: CBS domain-containing protein [Usitatibacteraceae bacterium]